MRKLLKTIICALWFLLMPTAALSAMPQSEISGIVTDRQDSRVARALVVFTDERKEARASTSFDGSFRIALKPGNYAIVVHAFGFCSGHRGAISLRRNTRIQINFQLVECGSVDPADVAPIPDRKDSVIRKPGANGNGYGEEELNRIVSTGLCPLVLFGQRNQTDSKISYSGLQRFDTLLPAVFTYNLLTLRAGKIVYDTITNRLEANGNVTLEDGRTVWRGEKISILVQGDAPTALSRAPEK